VRGDRKQQKRTVIGANVLAVLLLAATSLSAAPAFDAERAYRDLVKQCDFGPRVPNTGGHDRCADWLVAQLRALADSVTRQQFTTPVGDKTLRLTNIIATFNPRGKERVLLAAHWNTRPIADEDPDPAKRAQPILGANDGASGVAVLLEVARALKAHPPRQQVTIVLFDGEDYGPEADDMFLGSGYFAKHFHGTIPDWGVLLDMVGDEDLCLPVEETSQQRAPQVVERVWAAAERAGAPAFVRKVGPAILDDHIPLLECGIPCIDIIDIDYPAWHTTADAPDKCRAASLGQVGRTVLEALK
jgi:glutaminyl-peptide cyclotransferase